MAESAPNEGPGMHKFSCVLCVSSHVPLREVDDQGVLSGQECVRRSDSETHKRKVKCDRLEPCGYCFRHNDTCVYEAPPPPKRRKKESKSDHADLLARLQRAEDQLRQVAPASQFDQPSPHTEPSRQPSISRSTNSTPNLPLENKRVPPQGRLIASGTNTRYLDNSLWVTLDNELQNPDAVFREGKLAAGDAEFVGSDEEDNLDDAGGMLLGTMGISDEGLAELFPSPAQQMVLWQTYLDNVHYLCMIIHRPSFSKVVEAARTKGILSLPKNQTALIFSAYFVAAASLSNSQCESKLRQPRKKLLKQLRNGTRHALVRCAFTRCTDLVTLQAFVQFLLCMRNGMDSQTLWILSGAAFRIAQRMGVHRDDVDVKLSPFEAEMRRRLWHQLMILDFTSSELAGCAPNYSVHMIMDFDSRVPLNLNDEDLRPEMKDMPPERYGATDMIFCRLRYEFRAFFMLIHKPRSYKLGKPGTSVDASWNRLTEDNISMEEKDKCIDDLENRLQTNFLRFCDPINRLHNLTGIAARAAVAGMRLRAHHPRQFVDSGREVPQSERDLCFSLSMKIMKYDIMCHQQKELQGYIWHVRVYFQWHAFIFLLNELRLKSTGDEADKAWELCEESFQYHPELIRGEYALYRAIRAIALRAWSAREAELRKQGIYATVPQFIMQARERAGIRSSNGSSYRQPEPQTPTPQNTLSAAGYSGYGTPTAGAPQAIMTDPMAAPATNPQMNYAMSWPAVVPGEDLFMPKPGGHSPIDWDAWDSLVQMDLPTLEFGLEAFFK